VWYKNIFLIADKVDSMATKLASKAADATHFEAEGVNILKQKSVHQDQIYTKRFRI
jgi:hypothetical protein